MKCPICSSSETQIMKKGFSAGDACCGSICLGPFGLLCGATNSNKMHVHCSKCGHKFSKRPKDWECKNCGKEYDTKEESKECEQRHMQKLIARKNFNKKVKILWINLTKKNKNPKIRNNKPVKISKMRESKNIFKSKLFNFFSWFFAIMFFLVGLGTFTDSTAGGIFAIIAGLILLPPFLNYIKKYGLILKPWIRILTSLILLIIAMELSS